jgi:hypothetical protein
MLFELAKVMVIKIISCGWFGGVAAYCIGSVLVCVCVWCVFVVCLWCVSGVCVSGVCVCVVFVRMWCLVYCSE